MAEAADLEHGHRRGERPSAARAWAMSALVTGLVLAIDQLTKHLVRGSIAGGEEQRFLPGVQLVDTHNHGVAFGFLPGSEVLVTVLIAIALLVLLVFFARNTSMALIWLPTGMLLGGAIGNVLDRIRSGSVTDFIKLPLGWPPFNLADAAITIGIVLLFLVLEHARHGSS